MDLHDTLAEARSYQHTDAIGAFVALLDALMTSYEKELCYLKPENLARKQGAAMQCHLLKQALLDVRSPMELPRV